MKLCPALFLSRSNSGSSRRAHASSLLPGLNEAFTLTKCAIDFLELGLDSNFLFNQGFL